MSIPEFTRVLSEAASHTRHLYFHVKGEPLLHPLVEDMAALANRRGFFVNLTTNGDLLDRYPGLYRHLRQLNVSLHAVADPEALIRRLMDIRDTKICLRLWDGGQNERTAALLEALFGVPIGNFVALDSCNADRIAKEPRVTLRDNLFLSRAERFEWPDLRRPPLYPDGYCLGLKQQIGILADGTVAPCCLDGEGDIPLGNVFVDSLEGILASHRAITMLEGFRRRVAVEALCRRCSYKERF